MQEVSLRSEVAVVYTHYSVKRYDASSRRGSGLVIERATNSTLLKTGSRGPSHPSGGQGGTLCAKTQQKCGSQVTCEKVEKFNSGGGTKTETTVRLPT